MPEYVYAYDMTNGMTYIGNVNFEYSSDSVSRLEEYVAVPTIDLKSSIDFSLEEKAKEAYERCKKSKKPIRLTLENCIASRLIDFPQPEQ